LFERPPSITGVPVIQQRAFRIRGREDADAFYLPHRYMDRQRRKHRRTRRRRRGLPDCTRNLPRGLRTLAQHSYYLAPRLSRDRRQPAPTAGLDWQRAAGRAL